MDDKYQNYPIQTVQEDDPKLVHEAHDDPVLFGMLLEREMLYDDIVVEAGEDGATSDEAVHLLDVLRDQITRLNEYKIAEGISPSHQPEEHFKLDA